MKFTTIKQAESYIGGLSKTTKMPGYSWDISAKRCNIGQILRKKPGTICEKCYALRGNYLYPSVQNALDRRLEKLNNKYWVEALTFIIRKRNLDFFRMFASGDLQNVEHLRKIVQVTNNCAKCKFWLPTKEIGLVNQFIRDGGIISNNLVVRLSATMIDGSPPAKLARKIGVQVSSVKKDGYNCLAHEQNNECQDCRKCWDKRFFNISYRKH